MIDEIETLFKKYNFEREFNKIRFSILFGEEMYYWNDDTLSLLETYLKKGKVEFDTVRQLQNQLEVERLMIELEYFAKQNKFNGADLLKGTE